MNSEEKLSWTNVPSHFVLVGGSLAPSFNKCGQSEKLKPISSMFI